MTIVKLGRFSLFREDGGCHFIYQVSVCTDHLCKTDAPIGFANGAGRSGHFFNNQAHSLYIVNTRSTTNALDWLCKQGGKKFFIKPQSVPQSMLGHICKTVTLSIGSAGHLCKVVMLFIGWEKVGVAFLNQAVCTVLNARCRRPLRNWDTLFLPFVHSL